MKHARCLQLCLHLLLVCAANCGSQPLAAQQPDARDPVSLLLAPVRFQAAIDGQAHRLLCEAYDCGARWECLPSVAQDSNPGIVQRLAVGSPEYTALTSEMMTATLLAALKKEGRVHVETNARLAASRERFRYLLRVKIATVIPDALEQKGGLTGSVFGIGALLSFVAEESTARTSLAVVESELVDRQLRLVRALIRSTGAYKTTVSSNPTFTGTYIETYDSRRDRLVGAVQQALAQAAQDISQEAAHVD